MGNCRYLDHNIHSLNKYNCLQHAMHWGTHHEEDTCSSVEDMMAKGRNCNCDECYKKGKTKPKERCPPKKDVL